MIDRLPDEVLAALRCPVTRRRLRAADPSEIEAANRQLTSDGELACGFITVDGRYLYGMEDGIVLLLPEYAIPMVVESSGGGRALGSVKASVRRFYEELGWTRAGDAPFFDAQTFEDLRPVSAAYIKQCNLRVNRYLPSGGTFLLDAGSGPLQFPEYLTYSAGFERRLCVDFSFAALLEAKKALGDKGVYVLADVCDLPLGDGTVDGAVCLHTIYHVPADEQERAFRELHRVLAPGARAAVVYSWGNPLLLRVLHAPLVLRRWAKSVPTRGPQDGGSDLPQLYFRPNGCPWFRSRDWGFDYELAVWRLVSVSFLKMYVHGWLGGRRLLDLIYRFEERYPRLCGRIGQYPLIVIKK